MNQARVEEAAKLAYEKMTGGGYGRTWGAAPTYEKANWTAMARTLLDAIDRGLA